MLIFQLGGLKALGQDGMSGIFYHHCWDIVGNYLVDTVLSFFDNGRMVQEVNPTHLVLIPKLPNPKTSEQFRLIGLCNLHYKVIAQIINNCMRNNLGNILDESQSASYLVD